LDAGPQPDSSTMAASSTVIDLMALFMVPPRSAGSDPCPDLTQASTPARRRQCSNA
jgi:hypothetical protein